MVCVSCALAWVGSPLPCVSFQRSCAIVQAGSRRAAVVVNAAQKAEYIWYDGMEGEESKVLSRSPMF
jgi:hypothetical protein